MGWLKKLTGGLVDTKSLVNLGIQGGMAYATGGASLGATGVGSTIASGLMSGNSGTGNSILGAIGNYLGLSQGTANLLGGLVQGAVGLGQDYLTAQQQLKQRQDIAGIELQNNLALAKQQFDYNKQENQQIFKQNKALADQAYQQNVAMWNRQNAYDSPQQQMQRLQSAGLNPNLVYGGGHVTGNTASSVPQYTPPSVEAAQYNSPAYKLGLVDSYQKIENQAIQNRLLAENAWLLHTEGYRRSAKVNSEVAVNREKEQILKKQQKLLDKDLENYEYNKYLSPILSLLGQFVPKGAYKL